MYLWWYYFISGRCPASRHTRHCIYKQWTVLLSLIYWKHSWICTLQSHATFIFKFVQIFFQQKKEQCFLKYLF